MDRNLALSPLDQIMQSGYICMLLCFPFEGATEEGTQRIRHGLLKTVQQLPLLTGRAQRSVSEQQYGRLEVVWSPNRTLDLDIKKNRRYDADMPRIGRSEHAHEQIQRSFPSGA